MSQLDSLGLAAEIEEWGLNEVGAEMQQYLKERCGVKWKREENLGTGKGSNAKEDGDDEIEWRVHESKGKPEQRKWEKSRDMEKNEEEKGKGKKKGMPKVSHVGLCSDDTDEDEQEPLPRSKRAKLSVRGREVAKVSSGTSSTSGESGSR